MPTVTRFEDLEIWQLARIQTNDFNAISNEGPLTRDFELRNQMNASSGSVMDCIAEGFEQCRIQKFFSHSKRIKRRVSFATLSFLRQKIYNSIEVR